MGTDMRYKVTPRARELLHSLRRIEADIQPYVVFASSDAQNEWSSLQRLWPSNVALESGLIDLSETDLGRMESRVRRFGEIVRGLAGSKFMASAEDHAVPVGPYRAAATFVTFPT